MTDDWAEQQIAAGHRIIGDGIATYQINGTGPHEIVWREGEREKRETDENWRWAQRIMARKATA